MKIRSGFVSNSSSSSFIIDRSKLTFRQDNLITFLPYVLDYTGWTLFLTYGSIIGYTEMDNFDMASFFAKISVDPDAIHWATKQCLPFKDGMEFEDIMDRTDEYYKELETEIMNMFQEYK